MGATPDGYPPCPDSDCRIRAARTSDVDIAYGFETDYIKEIGSSVEFVGELWLG